MASGDSALFGFRKSLINPLLQTHVDRSDDREFNFVVTDFPYGQSFVFQIQQG